MSAAIIFLLLLVAIAIGIWINWDWLRAYAGTLPRRTVTGRGESATIIGSDERSRKEFANLTMKSLNNGLAKVRADDEKAKYLKIPFHQWLKIDSVQKQFSWGIPSEEMFDAIVKHCGGDKILSIGAGHGFWEYQLLCRGLAITATDIKPSATNDWYKDQWSVLPMEIIPQQANEAASTRKYDTLMMVWPHEKMNAGDIVAANAPGKVIYVGLGPKHSENKILFQILDADYDVLAQVDGPLADLGWPDQLIIYQQRKK